LLKNYNFNVNCFYIRVFILLTLTFSSVFSESARHFLLCRKITEIASQLAKKRRQHLAEVHREGAKTIDQSQVNGAKITSGLSQTGGFCFGAAYPYPDGSVRNCFGKLL